MNKKHFTEPPTIVCKMTREGMLDVLREAQESLTEEVFFEPFKNTIISTRTAAEVLGVHPDTLLEYVKRGELPSEPRTPQDANSHVRFNLGAVLKFRRDRELAKIRG